MGKAIRPTVTVSRRRFVKTAAASVVAPYVVPRTVFGKTAPSNRINLALIGVGNQSRVDLPSVLRFDDVQVLAVCDVNRGSHGYAKPDHFLGREPARDKVNQALRGKDTQRFLQRL